MKLRLSCHGLTDTNPFPIFLASNAPNSTSYEPKFTPFPKQLAFFRQLSEELAWILTLNIYSHLFQRDSLPCTEKKESSRRTITHIWNTNPCCIQKHSLLKEPLWGSWDINGWLSSLASLLLYLPLLKSVLYTKTLMAYETLSNILPYCCCIFYKSIHLSSEISLQRNPLSWKNVHEKEAARLKEISQTG